MKVDLTLQAEFTAKLDASMLALGFKRKRQYAYVKSVHSDALVYVFFRPAKKGGSMIVSPLVAIENLTLREMIGEDEPKQAEPRIANLYLAYTMGRPNISWVYESKEDLTSEFESMISAVSIGGIAFAEEWATFEGACRLISEAWAARGPRGIVIHPTVITEHVLKRLRA